MSALALLASGASGNTLVLLAVRGVAGGSGAVSSTFVMYGHHEEALLVPDIRWQYDRFAKPRNISLESYAMFDGKSFNLHDFETKI